MQRDVEQQLVSSYQKEKVGVWFSFNFIWFHSDSKISLPQSKKAKCVPWRESMDDEEDAIQL